MFFGNLIKKTKSVFRRINNLPNYIRFKIRRSSKNNNKKVLIQITSINPDRRLLQIIYHFLFCNCECYLKTTLLNYTNLDKFGIYSTLLNGVFPANLKKTEYQIIASDDKSFLDNFSSETLKIYLNFFIFRQLKSVNENDLFYPIGLHKNYLSASIEKDVLSRASGIKRKIGIIFAGNVNDSIYNDNFINNYLMINTRFEMFDYLIDKLNKDIIYIPENLDLFLSDIESDKLANKVVLINTNNFSIPKDIYFDILLNSNFFLHMCGVTYPYCHNQIESMMAGCIPITQFSNFFVPSFKNKENAFLFNTLEEMIQVINDITSCKYENELEAMTKNISDYYIKYFSFQSFKNKLSYLIDNKINYTNYYIVPGPIFVLNDLKNNPL